MMKKIVTFGEVMLRLAAPGYERFGQGNMLSATFGGAEANVAVSLANYGLPVSFVTRVPDNDIAGLVSVNCGDSVWMCRTYSLEVTVLGLTSLKPALSAAAVRLYMIVPALQLHRSGRV